MLVQTSVRSWSRSINQNGHDSQHSKIQPGERQCQPWPLKAGAKKGAGALPLPLGVARASLYPQQLSNKSQPLLSRPPKDAPLPRPLTETPPNTAVPCYREMSPTPPPGSPGNRPTGTRHSGCVFVKEGVPVQLALACFFFWPQLC